MVSTTISLDNKTPSSTSDSCSRSVVTAALPAIISHHHRTSSTNNTSTGGVSIGYYSNGSGSAVAAATTTPSTIVQKFDSASSLNEKISILFPKCRPKSDVNLNHPMNINNNTMITSPATSSLSSESSSTAIGASSKSPNISTNPFLSRHPTEKISYYYKTKEDYGDGLSGSTGFQPNSAVPTYTQKLLSQKQHGHQHQLSPPQQHGQQQQQQQHYVQQSAPPPTSLSSLSQSPSLYHPSQNPFINRDSFSSHWEARKRMSGTTNTTPASTVLNSPDLIDTIDARIGQYQKSAHHIRVGRSPVSHATGSGGDVPPNNSVDVVTPTKSSMAVVADGEVVVFDDIGENWQSNYNIDR